MLFRVVGPWARLSAVRLNKDYIKTGERSGKCSVYFIMVSFGLAADSELYPTLRTSKRANFQVDHQLVGS